MKRAIARTRCRSQEFAGRIRCPLFVIAGGTRPPVPAGGRAAACRASRRAGRAARHRGRQSRGAQPLLQIPRQGGGLDGATAQRITRGFGALPICARISSSTINSGDIGMTSIDRFEDHCWKDVIPEADIKLYAGWRRETFVGPRPALLAIDLYDLVYRGGPHSPRELNERHPNTCGILPTGRSLRPSGCLRPRVPPIFRSSTARRTPVPTTARRERSRPAASARSSAPTPMRSITSSRRSRRTSCSTSSGRARSKGHRSSRTCRCWASRA